MLTNSMPESRSSALLRTISKIRSRERSLMSSKTLSKYSSCNKKKCVVASGNVYKQVRELRHEGDIGSAKTAAHCAVQDSARFRSAKQKRNWERASVRQRSPQTQWSSTACPDITCEHRWVLFITKCASCITRLTFCYPTTPLIAASNSSHRLLTEEIREIMQRTLHWQRAEAQQREYNTEKRLKSH